MPHLYICYMQLTEEGTRELQDTVSHTRAFLERNAADAGFVVQELLWTAGEHGLVIVLDADLAIERHRNPDIALGKLLSQLTSLGDMRAKATRAFNEAEMNQIVGLEQADSGPSLEQET